VLLSVVIPCYNERETIATIVAAVRAVSPADKEIIIVDDGSTDGTRELLRNEIENLVDRVFYHEVNQGKGAALRTGFRAARGDIMLIQDADLEYDPTEYTKLLKPILEDRADVVFSSRFLSGEPHRVLYFWHRVGNGVLTLLSNIFTDLNLTDIEACYKVFRRENIQGIEIEEDRFGFDAEIIAKVAKSRCRVFEVGISYYGRTYAQGKKIGGKDAFRILWCILNYNIFR